MSQSAVIECELSKGKLALRVETQALVELEEKFDEPFMDVVSNFISGKMRLRNQMVVVAAAARFQIADVTPESVLNMAPTLGDLKKIRQGLVQAFAAALPPATDRQEEANEQPPGPS